MIEPWNDDIFRFGLIVCFLILIGLCFTVEGADWTDNQIADAIYRAENSDKYPYGIKSIDTKGDKDYARKICLNTIHNQRIRHRLGKCPEDLRDTEHDYLTCLWYRYCNPRLHPLNLNWLSNVKHFLKKGRNSSK